MARRFVIRNNSVLVLKINTLGPLNAWNFSARDRTLWTVTIPNLFSAFLLVGLVGFLPNSLPIHLTLVAADNDPLAALEHNPPVAPYWAHTDTDSTLVWKPEARLTWEDFRAVPGPRERLHALTSSDLNVQVSCTDDKLTVDVQAVFRPLESWSKSKDSAPLLAHEQAHFDLTEVHARLLRLSLLKLRMSCQQARTQLQPLVDGAFSTWQKEQDRYDAETNHGLDEKAQARWEKKIGQLLAKLPR